ncbi:SLBB domain-containing protein [Anaeromyxobacter terrae]|uniref:SLBB domain-containing protein n=1 Tax=Anaeromyxobacter terrae TaxID=2925406 RepID=UPI001F589FA5|nr:SLBB domain-containing protein [Anaeromyxobacter sp. SG22]
MHSTPLRRAVAMLLCCQPVFWMSNAVLAQTIQQGARPDTTPRQPGAFEAAPEDDFGAAPGAFGTLAPPDAPSSRGDLDAAQAERSALIPRTRTQAPVDEPVDPDRYLCGAGDVLELNFWGLRNSRLRVTIDLEGRAFVPKIGYLTLQGKTLTEARDAIRGAVSRFYPRLNFDVALAEPRTFLVQVVAGVREPGTYAARAVERVATVVARAGGAAPRASRRVVEIRRRDGSTAAADLALFALTGDVMHNPYLLDGDVVRVPFEELAVTVDGAVNRPGRYELIGTRDLAEVVQVAGGLAATATRQLPVSIVRRLPDDRQDQQLLPFTAGGQVPSAKLQHDDAVHLPDYLELQRSVMVVGAIKGVTPPSATGGAIPDEAASTRRLPFVEGDSVRTLLERVGGVGPLADLTGSYVLRSGKALPVDLYSLVMLRNLKADRPVELGDTLVIPFKRRNILVQGAVFTPGSYPYNPTFGIEQYLALAGGRNRFAQSLSDVRIITPNGETRKFSRDLPIDPGSSLVVPERNFSRSEIVQIVLGAASVLVSGVAVVLAAKK